MIVFSPVAEYRLSQPQDRIADTALQRARSISERGGCRSSAELAVGIENGDGVWREIQGLFFSQTPLFIDRRNQLGKTDRQKGNVPF